MKNKTYEQSRKNRRKQKEQNLRKKRRNIGTATFVAGASLLATTFTPLSTLAVTTKNAESTQHATIQNNITQESKQLFIEKINELVTKAFEKSENLTDLKKSELIAYAIQRSNWGTESYATSTQKNIYALPMIQDQQNFSLEQTIEKNQDMATYKSLDENLNDFIQLIKLHSKSNDSEITKEINTIINENNLTKYDTNEQIYIVQSGDTLSEIAEMFGLTIDQILNDNQLNSSEILHIGQKLIIKNGIQIDTQIDNQNKSIESEPIVISESTIERVENESQTINESKSETKQKQQLKTNNENTIDSETNNEITEIQPTESEKIIEEDQTENSEITEDIPNSQENESTDQNNQIETPIIQEPEVIPEQKPIVQQSSAPDIESSQIPNTNTFQGAAIIAEAQKYLGINYTWGGKTPTEGFDCSGLTQYVYRNTTGVEIGGWTVAQESAGTVIPTNQAQAGDLYFWGEKGSTYHVAIATGGGQFIHAPQPGDVVSYGSTQYFTPDFAVRVV